MPDPSQPFPQERQQLILTRLRQDGRVVAAELALEFTTSEDTIRRDLRELAKAGLCQRTYGGAVAISPASGPFTERLDLSRDRKAALALTAVTLVQAGQVLFLDSGTTSVEIARALPTQRDLTVVTHAPDVAIALLNRPGITTILIGGVMNSLTSSALGARAIRDVRELKLDLCFLGVCALSTELGLRGFDFEETEFKKAVVQQSNAVAAAVTTDKLETAAPFQIAGFQDLDHLILEDDAPAPLIRGLRKKRAALSIHQACSR